MNEVHATPKQGKTWTKVEEEYAKLLKQKLRNKAKTELNSIYGVSNMKIIDDVYIDTDTIRKNINKKWRILKVMDELEENSFVKMWTDGWCSTCNFDASKCAEQHECEAFKTLRQQWSCDDDNGGGNNEETV